MSHNTTSPPVRDDHADSGQPLTFINYDEAIGRRKDWSRKGHTYVDPEVLTLINRYRDAAGQIGPKPPLSEAINYLLCQYSDRIIDEIEQINSVARRHK